VMRRYWLVAGSVLVFMLALFFVVEALGVPLPTDPSPWLERGGALAALLGFALGRRGGRLSVRLVPPGERARADRLLARWGTLAIIVTRPVPLLAETTVIMAGASPLGWRRVALAALAGSLPGALLYALTGAVAASFQNGALVFVLVLFVAGVSWLVGRWLEPHLIRAEGRRT
jgi:uncharacterized membrane protein YdjX (TVP38/TMEM64 family)